MHKVDEKTMDKIIDMTDTLLGRNPIPDTKDILEKARHTNKYKLIAGVEEAVTVFWLGVSF